MVLFYVSHKMSNLEKKTLYRNNTYMIILSKSDHAMLQFLLELMETRHLIIISPFVSHWPFEISLPSNGLLRGHIVIHVLIFTSIYI